MLAVDKSKRNFTVALFTSLVMVGLLLYYILVYVPHNQERIDSRNFRVLSRVGDNLHHSIQASVTGLNKMSKDAKDPNKDVVNREFLKAIYRDSVTRATAKEEESSRIKGSVHLFRNVNEDYVHTSQNTGGEPEHGISTNSYELHFKAGNYHYAKNINQLLLPLLRKDVFQEFYIFKNAESALDSALNTNRIIYSTNLINISFFKPTASENTHKKGAAGNVLDIDIAGQPYKLFVVKQEVGYGHKWILCGAMPAKEYNARRMAIPNDAIGFVVLGLIVLLLSFPFLKLGMLSKKEQLCLRDIAFCFWSLYTGASILILLWLNASAYYGSDKETRNKQLEILATDVKSSFVWEVKNILNQINYFDKNISSKNDSIVFKDEKNQFTWKTSDEPTLKEAEKIGMALNLKSNVVNASFYPFFTRLSWIDGNGDQISTYSKDKKVSPLINVKKRPYIQKLEDGEGWQFQDKPDIFYLNALKSWLDGENYVIISKESKDNKAFSKAKFISMTTKLVSLTESILPPHFGFLIIDEEGEVLFHSNNKLDLNENFLQEAGNNYHVKAAIINKLDHHFNEFYLGGKKNMYIKHFPDLPLYVITFVDNQHIKFRYINNFILSNSLFLFYFISVAIILGILLFIAIQPTKIVFYQISLAWLRPQQRFYLAYKKLCCFLIITIAIIAGSITNRTSDSVFFMLLLAPFYFFTFAYFDLNGITLPTLKVNTIARNVLRFLIFIIVLLNVVAYGAEVYIYSFVGLALKVYVPLLLFQAILIAVWYLLTKMQYYLFASDAVPANSQLFEQTYFVLILLLVCLTSTLPAIEFYKDAYNRESELFVQYHQLYLDNAIERSEKNNPSDPGLDNELDLPKFIKSKSRIYSDFFYNTTHLHGSTLVQIRPVPVNAAAPDEKACVKPINFKPVYSSRATNNNTGKKVSAAFLANGTLDTPGVGFVSRVFTNTNPTDSGKVINFFFNKICPALHQVLGNDNSENLLVCQIEPAEQSRFVYASGRLYLKRQEDLIKKETKNLPPTTALQAEHFVSGIPYFSLLPHFWIKAFIFLVFLFFLIKYLIRRIFNINFTANLKLRQVDEGLLKDFSFQRIILVTLPGTFEENQSRFKNLVPDYETYKMVYVNLTNEGDFARQVPYIGAKDKVIVWVRHFEHLALQKESIIKKIKLLEFLKKDHYVKIILQTSEHPVLWEEKWKQKELPAEVENEMRQLLDIISEYWKVFLPLQATEDQPEPTKELSRIPRTVCEFHKYTLNQMVVSECESCPFLKPLQPLLQEYIEQNCEIKMLQKSDIILKIQSLAQLYYRMLWSSCTKDEKYMLFDMAQDGIVNARNIGILTSLLSKGLLIKDQNQLVRLFNQSFQYFILSAVSPEEAHQFKKDKNQGSRWEIYKVPLLIILIGAAAFIFLTQQDTWLTMVALLTGVSTLINLLPRFGFLLPALFLKKEAK